MTLKALHDGLLENTSSRLVPWSMVFRFHDRLSIQYSRGIRAML